MWFMCLVLSLLLNMVPAQEKPKVDMKKAEELRKKTMMVLQQKLNNMDTGKAYQKYKTNPTKNPNLSYIKDRLYGDKNAKNALVMFSDFACGHCKKASKDIMARVDENKKDVNLKYVFFPLDKECNKNLKGKLSDYSCPSFKVALCSEKEGKLKEAIPYLYEKGQIVFRDKKADIKLFVSSVGNDLKLKNLSECFNSDWLKKRMEEENLIYKGLAIPGTPIVLLNGKELMPVYRSKVLFKEFINRVNLEKDPK